MFVARRTNQFRRRAQQMREIGGCLLFLCWESEQELSRVSKLNHSYSEAPQQDGKGYAQGVSCIWAFLILAMKENGGTAGKQNARRIVGILEWLKTW